MTDLDNGADLRERMDRATADLLTPDGLADAVLTDGRRLRRRRRALTAATGTAAAAVVAALVTVSLGGGTATTAGDVATQPTPTPAPSGGLPSAWVSDDSQAEPYQPPAGWWDAPGHLLASRLQLALPDGVSVEKSEEDAGSLLSTLDSPTGPGGFQLILYPPDPEQGAVPEGPVTYTDGAGNEHTAVYADGPANRSRAECGPQAGYTDTCEVITRSDGVGVGRVTTTLQDGTITFYEATLLGPDGGLVYLSVWNATDEKPGPGTPTSAEVPPLTLDQLRGLVQDPVWTSWQP